jgi:hypothetical protein
MTEFMGQYVEHDVLADVGRFGRPVAGVHPHSTEVGVEAGIHRGPGLGVQWLAGFGQY